MKLSEQQLAGYERDGYLLLPNLLSATEVEVLREETLRLDRIETDHIFRKGAIRTIYRAHEDNGPTASMPYHAAARIPRVLEPMMTLLGDRELYVYNSKINGKDAVQGIPMLWHQDFGYWRLDRVPKPKLATIMLALGDTDEMSGCLYVIPGTHKLGSLKHMPDSTTTYHKQWVVEKERMVEILETGPAPVPLKVEAGGAAIFDCNTIHGSGHNLSGRDRWQAYLAYNSVGNKPAAVGIKRPDYMRSMNFAPLRLVDDDAIIAARPIAA